MVVSVFDLFSIGIGPSSSHTVGPMRAAARFVRTVAEAGELAFVAHITVHLYGSLGATGRGHGTLADTGRLQLPDGPQIAFDPAKDIVLSLHTLDFHSNGMTFEAVGADGEVLTRRTYYSVGGGFVVDDDEAGTPPRDAAPVPDPFGTAAELVALAQQNGVSIGELMARNEPAARSDVRAGLLHIWAVMQERVTNGLNTRGILPGGLRVKRRASLLAAADMADKYKETSRGGLALNLGSNIVEC